VGRPETKPRVVLGGSWHDEQRCACVEWRYRYDADDRYGVSCDLRLHHPLTPLQETLIRCSLAGALRSDISLGSVRWLTRGCPDPILWTSEFGPRMVFRDEPIHPEPE
jgi:hypothetical protein